MHLFSSGRRDKLLVAAGVRDGFQLKDLAKPDPRRVRRNLSAIINFHKFREDRLKKYQGYSELTVSMFNGSHH